MTTKKERIGSIIPVRSLIFVVLSIIICYFSNTALNASFVLKKASG